MTANSFIIIHHYWTKISLLFWFFTRIYYYPNFHLFKYPISSLQIVHSTSSGHFNVIQEPEILIMDQILNVAISWDNKVFLGGPLCST